MDFNKSSLLIMRSLFLMFLVCFFASAFVVIPVSEYAEGESGSAVSISDEGNYFKVVLDYTTSIDPYEMMQEYGEILSAKLPDIQADIDQFLYDTVEYGLDLYSEALGMQIPKGFEAMAIELLSEQLKSRLEEVKTQIPIEYIDELDGLASTLTNGDEFNLGDGLLSESELYFYHLFGDVGRAYQCSAIGVFGPVSDTGSNIVGRNFDLDADLEGYASVTEIIHGDQANSIYFIGWLGNLNAYTAFNEHGVFGSLVDTTGSGEPYSASGIYSYTYDLRYALENQDTLESVADYLSQHPYAFNHLFFLADAEKSQVLENNISGTGSNMRRELRSSDSELNAGITWEFDNVIVAVSAFMLNGNHDNFSDAIIATSRYQSYKYLLFEALADGVISWEEIKTIQSYDGEDQVPSEMEFGDIYNIGTRRITIFNPSTFELEIFFSQENTPPDDPVHFAVIPVSFAQEGK